MIGILGLQGELCGDAIRIDGLESLGDLSQLREEVCVARGVCVR